MTFGIEYGDIVERVACPRCDSPSVVRSRLTSGGKVYENHLTCDKCHNVKFCALVSVNFYLDQKKLLRLRNNLAKARTGRDKQRIEGRIKEIEERMRIIEFTQFKSIKTEPKNDSGTNEEA